jgi:hypothetical protein
MPVEHGLWRIDGGFRRLNPAAMPSEAKLEEQLATDTSLLGGEILPIGRQVPTVFGKRIDLIGINDSGDLYAIELKRDRTPREVVAQLLDYASWIKDLSYTDIRAMYEGYRPASAKAPEFEQAFADRFGSAPPEVLNQHHHLIIVASELDPSTERIVGYLASEYGVPINTLFFRYFVDDGREYLSRTWLIDPFEAESKASVKAAGKQEPWNGKDFYVVLGESNNRRWEDARRYGFVSAGQGQLYVKAMQSLFPGARIFTLVPGSGYVGVGIVKDSAVPVDTFSVSEDGEDLPILSLPHEAPMMDENSNDPERAEHLVRVDWIKTLPKEEGIWEKGMFAVPQVVARLRNRFTLERLTQAFRIEESG